MSRCGNENLTSRDRKGADAVPLPYGRGSLPICLSVTLVIALSTPSLAQEFRRRRATADDSGTPAGALAPTPSLVRGDEITPQQQASVERGLAWLAAHQQRNGAFTG